MKNTTRFFVLLAIAFFSANLLSAQILSESFDGNTFPPTGWTNVKVAGSATPGTWARVTSGSNPTASPYSGAGMAQYNSYSWSSGNAADLTTPVLDFSAGNYAVSFWMYRDAGQAAKNDRVEVFVNTNGASAGGTLLGTINRSTALAPVVNTTGWYQYTFSIPAVFNTANNHIIFKAISNFGNRVNLDDVQVFLNNAPDDVISVSTSDNEVCTNTSVTLTANGVVGEVNWYDDVCGGNLIGTGSPLTVTPTQTTTYYARNFDNGVFSLGCASATVTVNPVYNISISTSICPGATYTLPDGSTTDIDDVYTFNLTSALGCDSTVEITLTTSSVINVSISESICRGNSFVFDGNTYIDAGQYTATFTSSGGCDSVVTLDLTVIEPVSENITETICEGKEYLFDGITLTVAGNYNATFIAASGCDSIVNLSLIVTPSVFTNLSETICSGDSLLFNGIYIKLADTYFDTLLAVSGCDSIISLNLIVIDPIITSLSESICNGDSLLFNGAYIKLANTYFDTLVAASGCDSIIELTLTINALPQVAVIQNNGTLEADNSTFVSYQWYQDGNLLQNAESNTLTPTENGSYSVMVEDANGCKNISDEFEFVIVGNALIKNTEWVIFPNPAKDIVSIKSNSSNSNYRIFSVEGKIVMEGVVKNYFSSINISKLNSGVYFVHVINHQGFSSNNVLVKE